MRQGLHRSGRLFGRFGVGFNVVEIDVERVAVRPNHACARFEVTLEGAGEVEGVLEDSGRCSERDVDVAMLVPSLPLHIRMTARLARAAEDPVYKPDRPD